MKTVNMHDAKTHLSKLVAAAEAGEPFLIARAGKPVVKVMAAEPTEEKPGVQGLLGCLAGTMTSEELDAYFDPELDKQIEDLFYAEDPLLTDAMERPGQPQSAERDKTA
jgi:prevent-host-death family protein